MNDDKTEYHVIVVRGIGKESLATKLRVALEPDDPDEIVSINVGVDWWVFPFRRNWAVVVVKS
jgi:hypothetical protein